MSAPSRRPRGFAARALEEALGAIAAPSVRDAILGSALSRAGLLTVPDDAVLLDAFVRGELAQAIAERLGDDAADGVLTELWPMLATLRAHALRSGTPPGTVSPSASPKATPVRRVDVPRPREMLAPTTPPPNASDDLGEDLGSGVMVVSTGKSVRAGDSLPVLLAVTRDPSRARQLGLALTGRAVVRPVTEILEMQEAIEDHRGELPVVLFDCRVPPFHLESVATFAGDLPPGSWLALLEATPELERVARGFAGNTLTVVRISMGAGDMGDVARRCMALFD